MTRSYSNNSPLAKALAQLLRKENMSTHEELSKALEKQGFKVTQSTVSRLLHKLRAVKAMNAHRELVYVLPQEHQEAKSSYSTPKTAAPSSDITSLVLSIEHNEQVIMVHTPPGSANIVALLIDANRLKCHLLGTIAGDDTILIVPSSVSSIERSLGAVKALLSGR